MTSPELHLKFSLENMARMDPHVTYGQEYVALLVLPRGQASLVWGSKYDQRFENAESFRLPSGTIPRAVSRFIATHRTKFLRLVQYFRPVDYHEQEVRRQIVNQIQGELNAAITPEMFAVLERASPQHLMTAADIRRIQRAATVGDALQVGLDSLRYCYPMLDERRQRFVITHPEDSVTAILNIWNSSKDLRDHIVNERGA